MAKPQIGDAIKDDLLRYLGFIQSSLDAKTAEKIASEVVNEMILLIKKGISPIQGQGRFPAYKWAALRNDIRKQKSSIARALKKNKQATFRFRRMNQRQLLTSQKEASRKKDSRITGRYPFTAEAIKAGKKPRPVNLTLHGDFLNALQGKIVGTAGQYGIEIGFFEGWKDAKGVEAWLKEEGHRLSANGQPSRPTIPIGTEEFAVTIQNIIWKNIEEAIDRAANSSSS